MIRLVVVLGLLAGCGPIGGPGGSGGEGEPVVEVGTGEYEFEAITEGQELQVIQGPQGGFHVLGSLRCQGLVPGDRDDLGAADNPTVTFDVVIDGESFILFEDGESTAEYTQGLDAYQGSDGDWTNEMTGRLVKLDIASDDEVEAREATVSVVVADVEGDVGSDSIEVVLVPHPFNENAPGR